MHAEKPIVSQFNLAHEYQRRKKQCKTSTSTTVFAGHLHSFIVKWLDQL